MNETTKATVWWGCFAATFIASVALAAVSMGNNDTVLMLIAMLVACVSAFLGTPIYLAASKEAE